jgi:glycosyltransferase involved in cell wall biosynthesis
MSQPLVSVVIPCYNAERWIGRTLESVQKQTWRNIQVVVVNDGSTDASESRIRELKYPDLVLINQPNRGSSAAINRGLQDAKGDFIQYLDADDLIHPEKIERQMRRLMTERDCVATSEWARFYTDFDDARFLPDENWRDLDPVDWLVSAWRVGGGMLFPAQWLIPKSIVEGVGAWREDLTLNNDGEYFTRVVLASRRLLFCEGARAYYRSGLPGSLSKLKSEKGWISQEKSQELCQQYLLAAENSDRTRRAIALLWQRFAHTCYPYHPHLANEALRKARALHPVSMKPEGGPAMKIALRLVGWKAARRLQHWYYRWRYGLG